MFQLRKIRNRIYLLTFDDHYELCMHFLRVQEFYESSDDRFINRSFNLVDFMQWYAKKYGNGAFTYPKDWAGFNVPGPVLYDCYKYNDLKDENRYDMFMKVIFQQMYNDVGDENFYLIGGNSKAPASLFKHELAHALFFTDKEYKERMLDLIRKIPATTRISIFTKLNKKMYNDKVHEDETQAYLATGLSKFLNTPSIRKQRKPFIDFFEKYTKDIKVL